MSQPPQFPIFPGKQPIEKVYEAKRLHLQRILSKEKTMKFILKADELTFFVGTKADVRPVNSYENGENKGQKHDEITNTPIWAVAVEMIQGEEVEAVSLKIVSAVAPELSARTEYKAKGVLTLSPYVNSNNNRSAVSLTLTGTLEKATALPRLENK